MFYAVLSQIHFCCNLALFRVKYFWLKSCLCKLIVFFPSLLLNASVCRIGLHGEKAKVCGEEGKFQTVTVGQQYAEPDSQSTAVQCTAVQ